jgi:hypothetical protein
MITETCRRHLPQDRCSLAGEVLEVWRHGEFWELTLGDIKEDDLAVAARLPATEPRPREGYTISIVGQYVIEPDPVDASFRLVFDGIGRDSTWAPQEPKRRRERRELIERLKRELPAVALDREPSRIALVTSRGSAAVEDFKVGLGNTAESVRCEQVSIPLEEGSVSDIAEGIRRAGALDVDLVVIARGGGRAVMLQRFSHTDVIEAVAAISTRVPVIVAVGHERDRVAAERFAWRRASTPTHAGSIVASEIRIRRWQQEERLREERARATAMSYLSTQVESPAELAVTSAPGAAGRPSWKGRREDHRRRRSSTFRPLVLLFVLLALGYWGWSVTNRARERSREADQMSRPRSEDARRDESRPSTHSSKPRHRPAGTVANPAEE